MEEEGSWPRLGLLLLSGTAVWWLVLCFCFLLFISVRRLVDRHGVAESIHAQCSSLGCRLLSSVVRAGTLLRASPGQRVGEGHCCLVLADQRHGRGTVASVIVD